MEPVGVVLTALRHSPGKQDFTDTWRNSIYPQKEHKTVMNLRPKGNVKNNFGIVLFVSNTSLFFHGTMQTMEGVQNRILLT